MPLGREVGLGPFDIVLDGDPAPIPQKKGGTAAPPPCTFRPMSIVAKRLDGLGCHLLQRQASAQATLCQMGTQLPPKRETAPNFRPISVVTKQLMEVGRGPGHIVLNGDHHHHHQVCLINSWQTQHVYNVDRESKIAGRQKLVTVLINTWFTAK